MVDPGVMAAPSRFHRLIVFLCMAKGGMLVLVPLRQQMALLKMGRRDSFSFGTSIINGERGSKGPGAGSTVRTRFQLSGLPYLGLVTVSQTFLR